MQAYVHSVRKIVVDVDSEKFFDRVDHGILMDGPQERIQDVGEIRPIRTKVISGIVDGGVGQQRTRGTSQGGPLLYPPGADPHAGWCGRGAIDNDCPLCRLGLTSLCRSI